MNFRSLVLDARRRLRQRSFVSSVEFGSCTTGGAKVEADTIRMQMNVDKSLIELITADTSAAATTLAKPLLAALGTVYYADVSKTRSPWANYPSCLLNDNDHINVPGYLIKCYDQYLHSVATAAHYEMQAGSLSGDAMQAARRATLELFT